MSQAAILFQDVNYSADDLKILKNINGYFPEGKIATIVGPSGAGKSTLFKLCNGLRSPDSGEILIKGKPIINFHPVELRRKVGIALQSATMISGSVLENLELPLRLQGKTIDIEFAKELLHDVGLDGDFLMRNAKELSGGQQQKLSIARTLVNQPEVLLLDEITSSLDRVSQHDIEELIEKINEKYGTTMIWITHNLEQALRIGQYTWVMMNGELIESGESSLLRNPQDKRVQEFVKGEIV
ncbi:phosphate ABC transporter ATP-binding protein [Ornithinibacillus bavariensis]|uniref:ABC transporter ATP-binding protein n=1 Tax=Ornithinibacillus bavariensis TaxID=545502 RepID=UPI000EBB3157|nr:phosphate ABC transporter ATP-binding protein [Ornithinibacillus sp.]